MGVLEAYFFRLYIGLSIVVERKTSGKKAAQSRKKRGNSRNIHSIQRRGLSLGVVSQGTEHKTGENGLFDPSLYDRGRQNKF